MFSSEPVGLPVERTTDTRRHTFKSFPVCWPPWPGWLEHWPRTTPLDQAQEQQAAQLAVDLLQKARGQAAVWFRPGETLQEILSL